MTNKEIYNKLYQDLDYWCEQYKYVNEVTHDIYESERISKNIRTLENALKLYK